MVEKIGGHTWNVWDGDDNPVPITNMRGKEPLEQLRLMGFAREAAIAMAREEHEDWCRYYKKAGWRYGTPRDNPRKIHDKLIDWDTIEADPDLFRTALSSLATTLIKLHELGYRSRPIADDVQWQTFRRTGTVVAEQKSEPWTWTTRSGEACRPVRATGPCRKVLPVIRGRFATISFVPATSTSTATGGDGTES